MDKLNGFLKNVLIFLVIFLGVNYLFSSCQNKNQDVSNGSGNFVISTTKQEFSRRTPITVKIANNTKETVTIPSECPNEPFDVYKKENNKWNKIEASPKFDCEFAKDIKIEPGKQLTIPYTSWNNALFGSMGLFKIEATVDIDGKPQTFSTNEFTVVKEGLFKQLTYALFYRPIYNALIFLTDIVPGHNLGLAIILLTIIIRTILLIPAQKAMVSQRKLQEIQPRLDKIREKYKGDQQKIATETMNIWKEAKVNPLGSCLPMLLQLPFLLALFYVIRDGLNPDNTYLLYGTYKNFTISDINIHFLGLNLIINNLYILPLVVGGLQFVQMKLAMFKKPTSTSEKGFSSEMAMATNMMIYIMPVMIALFTATTPAGVGLYWGISTLYGIVQQLFVNKQKTIKDDNEPTVKVITK